MRTDWSFAAGDGIARGGVPVDEPPAEPGMRSTGFK